MFGSCTSRTRGCSVTPQANLRWWADGTSDYNHGYGTRRLFALVAKTERQARQYCGDFTPIQYELTHTGGKYCSRQVVKELSSKYNNYPDNLPMDDYYQFNKKVLLECLRVADTVFYNVQFLTGNKPALFKLIGDFSGSIKEFIVWDKANAQPAIGAGIMNSQFEVILVLQKSAPESRKFTAAQWERGTLSNHWSIKRGRKPHKDHGAVFPEELVQRVVQNFTSEGDVVLDPFMGTGTTGVVCAEMNRKFIGFEQDTDYYKFALGRVQSGLTNTGEQHVHNP